MSSQGEYIFRLHEKGPPVVREVLLEKGWTEFDEEDTSPTQYWNMWWKSSRFTPSQMSNCHFPYQRVNHFPKSSEITHKDNLLRNLRRMKGVYGSIYEFFPEAWILPNEYVKFCQVYSALREVETDNKEQRSLWICKPSDLSRGRKIFVFRELHELSYDCSAVVQQYIANPLLLFDHKFDMRIYVLVTSFHPLRIYVYRDMIARFATERFDLSNLSNNFSHLTNTSLNKFGPSYVGSKDGIGEGCKWTFAKLDQLFKSQGVDFASMWARIDHIVILTLLSIAPAIPTSCSPACFELFGFDILLDSELKPWLLEVNFAPALAVEEPTDWQVKKPLISDIMDTLNIKTIDEDFVPVAEDDYTRRLVASNRPHPRIPNELTAAQAQRAGNLVPYPLPRGYSRPVIEEKVSSKELNNNNNGSNASSSSSSQNPSTSSVQEKRGRAQRSLSLPSVNRKLNTNTTTTTTTTTTATTTTAKTATVNTNRRPSLLERSSSSKNMSSRGGGGGGGGKPSPVDSAAGNFALIFPFNDVVAAQDLSKGDTALRVIVAEIKKVEVVAAKACKQQAGKFVNKSPDSKR